LLGQARTQHAWSSTMPDGLDGAETPWSLNS
jgi:hypothetical protein